MARGGASPGMGYRGVSRSNPATLKSSPGEQNGAKMKLQDVITKLSDLDPEKEYDFTISENKLDVKTTEKPKENENKESEEMANLKKEVEDLKKVNKSLLEKTTVANNDSVEDIVASIVGLKKEE